MDKSKISSNNKTGKKDDSIKTENEPGNTNLLRIQEFYTSTESQDTDARALAPNLSHIYKEEVEFPDDQQEKDKDYIMHQSTVEVSPEEESSTLQDSDNSDDSLTKKYLSSVVSKCQSAKNSAKGILKRIKSISGKGKKPNERTLKSKSPKLFRKKKKYNLQSEKDTEISTEERKIRTELRDSMPRGDYIITKPEVGVLRKVTKNPSSVHKSMSATSAELTHMSKICSVKPTSVPIVPRGSATTSGSSKVRSAKEVLAHFKRHMQSYKKSFDITMTSDISEEDMETATNYVSQNLQDHAEEAMESESGDNLISPIKNTTSNQRQRIVYNENVEYIRKWILEQIKDKEVVLKFRIMEGKYSDDAETKMNCIEAAKHLQSQIDILFDILDDHDKFESVPKQLKGFWKHIAERDVSVSPTESVEDLSKSPIKSFEELQKSPRKRIKHSEYREERLNNYLKLFEHLSQGSEYQNENIHRRVNPRKFVSDYNVYVVSKKKRDEEGEKLKNAAVSAVEEFYQSLEQCRSRVKSKIARPEIRTLKDYQNYIIDLRTVLEENLDCLYTIIPLATSLIFPLMSYLSQSQIKFVHLFSFLGEERPYLMSERSNRNQAFFQHFCQHHFKQ